MKIAVIDDGIFPQSVNLSVKNYLVQNGIVKVIDGLNIAPLSHGSICAKIIEKYVNCDVSIIGIQILNEDDTGLLDDLIVALKWCHENDVRVINLSCGLSGQVETNDLLEICQKLHNDGVEIVAAQNNNGALTYPACFPCVTSVEQRNYQTNYLDWYRISDIYAEGEHLLTHGDTAFYSVKCNSFACAYASAHIINKLLDLNNDTEYPSDMFLTPFVGIYDFAFLAPYAASTKSDDTTVCSNHSVVITPPNISTKRSLLKLITDCRDRIDFIVWCGKRMPKYLRKWCLSHNVKYWDERIDQSRIYSPPSNQPCIYFSGDKFLCDNTIKLLSELFANEGYKTLLISDYEHSYLYGYKKVYRKGSIDLYAYHFDPDIILYQIKNTRKFADEVIVNCENQLYSIKTADAVRSYSDIASLYNAILDYCL